MPEPNTSKLRTIFVGSKELGFSSLKILKDNPMIDLEAIITFDDLEDTRTHFNEFKAFAEMLDIPLHLIRTNNIKNVNADLKELLSNYNPDFTFIVGWYWKLYSDVLTLSKKGIYGIHSADLPRYKGSAPVVWALIFAEEKIGVSFFRFAKDLDKGEVFAKVYVRAKDRYIGEVLADINNLLKQLIDEGIQNVIRNQPISLPPDDGLYYLARTPEDARIEWQQSSEKINRSIRAQSHPYPGAYFYYGNEKFNVYKSEVVDSEYRYIGVLGSIFTIQKRYIKVICRDKCLIKLSDIYHNSEKITDLRNYFTDKKIRLK